MRYSLTDPKRNRVQREGIGMTSMRTRHRLVETLKSLGVEDPVVLEVMLKTPRHDDDQFLLKITRTGNYFTQQKVEAANFVPLVNGLM